ncbi:hypothetical protein MTR_1g071830 [Medicago truncatula]|uniref:DUF4283 domain protein n=1 Tax=Medicago truncatula TaxID=3880 RepID=G7IDN6_MEDTR|nr:hypothetical protein MTR_1g071830 [Medicago truncatula]
MAFDWQYELSSPVLPSSTAQISVVVVVREPVSTKTHPKKSFARALVAAATVENTMLLLNKGDKPYTSKDIIAKLKKQWTTVGPWKMLSLGKGYFEFSFEHAHNEDFQHETKLSGDASAALIQVDDTTIEGLVQEGGRQTSGGTPTSQLGWHPEKPPSYARQTLKFY